ncbi:peptidase C39 [Paraburkholderia sp. A1RI_3L]|uniref:peptidase C39 n=1 Tax=Paraburkholderia TaxID=1822464 RepID=UPI003B7F5F9D
MDRNLLTAGCALCITTLGLASVAHAAGQGPTVFDNVPALRLQAVDDNVLAAQTGKGLAGDIISGVVVELLSSWKMPNGATAVAQGALSLVTGKLNQVAAQVSSQASVTEPAHNASGGANPNAGAAGGENVSVNGVSQITQIAGNSNIGSNQAAIDFNAATNAHTSPAAWNNATSAAASSADGSVKAGITFGSGGIKVALQTPAGIATQTVAPTNAQQASMIGQLLQIAGNNQQVANQLQLHLQTQPMSADALRQLGVLQALQNGVRR